MSLKINLLGSREGGGRVRGWTSYHSPKALASRDFWGFINPGFYIIIYICGAGLWLGWAVCWLWAVAGWPLGWVVGWVVRLRAGLKLGCGLAGLWAGLRAGLWAVGWLVGWVVWLGGG